MTPYDLLVVINDGVVAFVCIGYLLFCERSNSDDFGLVNILWIYSVINMLAIMPRIHIGF